MYRIITALCLLSFTVSANTMSGAMMSSLYPPPLLSGATVDIGGGSTSTGCTVSSTGDLTCTSDLIANGQDLKTPATAGDDEIRLQPAGTTSLTVTEAGGVQISKVVTAHSACAAAGDRGKIDVFSVGDTVSFCGCRQSAAATYSWVALHADGVC